MQMQVLSDTPRIVRTPTSFPRTIKKYEIILDRAKCTACGKCVEACPDYIGSVPLQFEAFKKTEGFILLHNPTKMCDGESCSRCIEVCEPGALTLRLSPEYESLGDYRWTPDLILSTWEQGEFGDISGTYEHRIGNSGGGFDRLRFEFELSEEQPRNYEALDNTEMDTSINLNRRDDGRPITEIPIPVYSADMSYGSISLNTMLARAKSAQVWHTFTSTGEGGYPAELIPYKDVVITQVATGHFGVNAETIKRAPIIVLKYAQGAKPGLGGHLLADKNTLKVAALREVVPFISLFSPFPFHNVYSVEDHYRHVQLMKDINPRALVSVKVSTPTDVDMVAIGSYYAGANILQVDGGYGGTGAAPDISKKNIGMPVEYAIPIVHNCLVKEGLRDKLTLMASGGIRTAWDVAKIISLGADGVVLGTAELVSLGCKRCQNCERGRGCPSGICTTDPVLGNCINPDWGAQRLVNLYSSFKKQWHYILQQLGLNNIRDLCPTGEVQFQNGRFGPLVHLDHLK